MSYGHILKQENFLVFFGNKYANLEILKSNYPNLSFSFLKQCHGSALVHIDKICNHQQEADAQHTSIKNIALCIKTADCIPILVYEEKSNSALAIHAGWRGIENQIFKKSFDDFSNKISLKNPLFRIFIGPHILLDSFEVELSVFQQIKNSNSEIKMEDFFYKTQSKYYIDLLGLLKRQILNTIKSSYQIDLVIHDTKVNSEYCSFRRDKTQNRNISFISLL